MLYFNFHLFSTVPIRPPTKEGALHSMLPTYHLLFITHFANHQPTHHTIPLPISIYILGGHISINRIRGCAYWYRY